MSDLLIDNRLYPLVEIALKKDYCSLNYFAERLEVSTRTVRNYIKQLNSDLKGIASFVNHRGKGYQLVIENVEEFNRLLDTMKSGKSGMDSPQARLAYVINRLMNNERSNTLDEIAFDMNIGRTTLVTELKKAKMSLNSYNLAIQGKPNKGMYLSGTELDLRFFILDNLYDFLYSANHLDKEIEDAIIKIANHYDLESSTKKKLMQFIVVMLDRISKNKFLSVMKDKYMKLLETREYQVALEISTVIEKYFSIKIPEFEVLFMTIPIAGRRTPTNNKMMVDISISEDMIQLVHRIVEQIGFNENIIRENQAFFTDLQYHLTLMLNRLMFNLRLKNPLLSDVKEKYPVAYKMAEIAGDVIEKEYHLKVPKDELGYIAFYFGVLNSKNEIKTKRLQRVAVVCGTGRGTSELVAIQLQRILRQNTKIDVFSENDITKETLAPYDIVFSTVDIDFQTDSPLIRISEIFDENSILQKIEEVTFLHKFKIKSKGNSRFIIKVLANSDKFFVLDDKKSYQKNVDDMIDAMINRGYLDEGFKERIIERARKGSMVFDRYIAMPHTINHQSDQVVLAVGVFPNEIQEEGKEIKLVFLLGLPEQTNGDASMLVKIYDEILQIAKDENLIHQLSRSNSYQDFAASLDQPTR